MYFHDYREEKHGITEYASIPAANHAQHCLGCPAPCEQICPHHLPVKKLLLDAHAHLTV
jgi:predicted aldo/keto reductase-like oxidoreductase